MVLQLQRVFRLSEFRSFGRKGQLGLVLFLAYRHFLLDLVLTVVNTKEQTRPYFQEDRGPHFPTLICSYFFSQMIKIIIQGCNPFETIQVKILFKTLTMLSQLTFVSSSKLIYYCYKQFLTHLFPASTNLSANPLLINKE